MDPCFLELLHQLEVSGQLYASAALALVKELRYPLDRRLSGPQRRSGRDEVEENHDPIGIRTPIPRSSSPQPVAISTTLSRLLPRVIINH
jgi:hypothetical protein